MTRGSFLGNDSGIAASLALLGTLLSACGGTAIRGAKPWSDADEWAVVRTQPLARYQMNQCTDALGQPLPTITDRLTLFRTSHSARVDGVWLLSGRPRPHTTRAKTRFWAGEGTPSRLWDRARS